MDANRLNQGSLVGEKKNRIIDDYKIAERLGKGAFSEVFLATHRSLGIKRCIKVTRKRSNSTPQENDAVLEEVRILKDIDHPNIMRVYEYYQDSQNIYVVSEYLSGGELFDRIVASKYFTEAKAKVLMQKILSAISYLHKKKIVHRDMKPENICFESKDENADVKIIDFGTSKKMQQNEILKTKLGTAYYIAPEVLSNSYDSKCDIWSCGVIFYILMCGYPPFNAKTDDEIFKKIQKGVFVFPDEEWKKVSPEAKKFVQRMLTLKPASRPTADELLKDPWFSASLPKEIDTKTNVQALKNLSDFTSGFKLQKAVLIYFVSFFDLKEEKARLLKAFQELDKDHDGQLTKDELIAAYKQYSNQTLADKAVEDIIKKVDFNSTTAIDFSEFLVANLNYQQSMNDKQLEQLFQMIDKDKNGFITSEELKEFFHLGDAQHEAFVKEMINEVDKNNDGLISFAEFEDMMKQFLKRF